MDDEQYTNSVFNPYREPVKIEVRNPYDYHEFTHDQQLNPLCYHLAGYIHCKAQTWINAIPGGKLLRVRITPDTSRSPRENRALYQMEPQVDLRLEYEVQFRTPDHTQGNKFSVVMGFDIGLIKTDMQHCMNTVDYQFNALTHQYDAVPAHKPRLDRIGGE